MGSLQFTCTTLTLMAIHYLQRAQKSFLTQRNLLSSSRNIIPCAYYLNTGPTLTLLTKPGQWPGKSSALGGHSKASHSSFCPEAHFIHAQVPCLCAHCTYSHTQRSFSVTETIIRYLKLGRKEPYKTVKKNSMMACLHTKINTCPHH